VPNKNVPDDEWTELVPSSAENDYSIVVEEKPIYLFVGDRPAQPVAGLPLREGAIYSLNVDRFEGLYGRSQTDLAATVRVVPNLRIEGSNERAVSVSTTVDSDKYDRGDDFDTSSYPVTLDPPEQIKELLLPIVQAEILVEITTVDGDIVEIPVDGKSTIDSYLADKVVLRDPKNNGTRVAGGWAGE